VEEADVVVGSVQQEEAASEALEKRRQIEPRNERVDQEGAGAHRDLDETDLLEVVVERVGLGVERNLVIGFIERRQEDLERTSRVDEEDPGGVDLDGRNDSVSSGGRRLVRGRGHGRGEGSRNPHDSRFFLDSCGRPVRYFEWKKVVIGG
jgi:hypothetical protein